MPGSDRFVYRAASTVQRGAAVRHMNLAMQPVRRSSVRRGNRSEHNRHSMTLRVAFPRI